MEAKGEHMKPLDDKPALYQDLIPDWQAFSVLSSSRQMGFSVGPIPLSEIAAYMEINQIKDYEERKLLLHRIHILDHTYLDWQSGETKKQQAKEKLKKSPKLPRR